MLLAGCGGRRTATPAEAHLEREDLVAVARALRASEPAVEGETAAAKAAWPYLLDGLPAHPSAQARARILAAARSAAQLPLPPLLAEREAAALTGPASPLAGRYRDFQELSTTSWRMIAAALREVERGPPDAARFARANVGLYVEGVYDASFSIAEAGEAVLDAYRTLGEAPVFGTALTQQDVQELVDSYSRVRDRLEPHKRVKLGS